MTARRWLAPYLALSIAAALLLVVGVSGCGIGATDRPVDEGDAASGETRTGHRADPPEANDATTGRELVRTFLQASAGGYTPATERVRNYLTKSYQARWHDPLPPDNPPLTVVRVLGEPEPGPVSGERSSFTVSYEPIGTMTDAGRVDDPLPPDRRTLRFWVVAEEGAVLRIDEIENWPDGQLLLSDAGLMTYYQVQPIYFWDAEVKVLVPDVRYLPLTLNPDQRADRILDWLSAGPSPSVSSAVLRLPQGISFDNVGTEADGRLAVDLADTATGVDEDALRRLTYQLQWSLESALKSGASPTIELRLDGQSVPVPADPDDYRTYNHSYTYTAVPNSNAVPNRYDIKDGAVVAPVGRPTPAVLNSPANTDVVWAAVTTDGSMAAFVRSERSGRSLQLVTADAPAPRGTAVPNGMIGRPIFVPESSVVLVPSDGQLLAVSTKTGAAVDAAHGFDNITSVDVSPDGRRVAFVAGGATYVAALVVRDDQAAVASGRRELLAGRLSARAVVWTSQFGLLVAGTSSGAQALWKVSPDGVLLENRSSGLDDLVVNDLVSYPKWPNPDWTDGGNKESVYAFTTRGIYSYYRTFSAAADVIKPFYSS